jgi:hypothetical protein
MGKIGFSRGATDLLYLLDEEIHRTSADAERYNAQMTYIDHLPRCTLMSNTTFSLGLDGPCRDPGGNAA